MNILIADDSDMIRSRMKKMISSIPNVNVVDEAFDGEDAMEKIIRHRPDLAILDIRMPKKNGIELTSEIKKMVDVKVFIVTNYYDTQSVSSAKNAGADYVFDKSTEIDVLMKFVTLYSELI